MFLYQFDRRLFVTGNFFPITLFILSAAFMVAPLVWAQESSSVDERRAELERELAQLEERIEAQRTLLESKQRESVSLERDIAILDAQIEKARLEIRAREIVIGNLGSEISSKSQTIMELDKKIERERRSLAQLLRETREFDSISLVHVAFSNESLSGFFGDLDDFRVIERELAKSFNQLRATRKLTREEKEELEAKRQEEIELQQIQELEKRRIEEREAEKQRLLAITKGEEERYQQVLEEQQKTAAEIRAELFRLRGTAAIPFGEALEYANFAAKKTGVRPALILGVIAEESNLGENLGSGTWREDMHPDRDRPVFRAITAALGVDPDKMPVSAKPWYGWGGAMGPAQFIPSTWVCYGGFVNTSTGECGRNPDRSWVGPWEYVPEEDRIRALLGKSSPANPWEPRDAFMAAGLLLMENGADKGTRHAERLAALRYFAGWTNAEKSSYAFYGDDVMNLADKYQNQIDILQGG